MANGLECVLPHLGELDFAIVGEPTLMQLAIAERGLVVIDCTARGRAGMAAREEWRQCHLPRHERYRMVPHLPFSE